MLKRIFRNIRRLVTIPNIIITIFIGIPLVIFGGLIGIVTSKIWCIISKGCVKKAEEAALSPCNTEIADFCSSPIIYKQTYLNCLDECIKHEEPFGESALIGATVIPVSCILITYLKYKYDHRNIDRRETERQTAMVGGYLRLTMNDVSIAPSPGL